MPAQARQTMFVICQSLNAAGVALCTGWHSLRRCMCTRAECALLTSEKMLAAIAGDGVRQMVVCGIDELQGLNPDDSIQLWVAHEVACGI